MRSQTHPPKMLLIQMRVICMMGMYSVRRLFSICEAGESGSNEVLMFVVAGWFGQILAVRNDCRGVKEAEKLAFLRLGLVQSHSGISEEYITFATELEFLDATLHITHEKAVRRSVAMPHATLPSPGFQAVILCGPGASLDTFTSNLEEFPKALVPIANKPMVWYPIEWCSRMGITGISYTFCSFTIANNTNAT